MNCRKDCPMRHENGNCLPAGGFCTAVSDPICEALHNAYDSGNYDGITEAKKKLENVTRMDFTELLGGQYEVDRLVLFNKEKISEKEVEQAIFNGMWDIYDKNMICITPEQFENVFG